jgi:hypothetical protein
MGEDLDCAEHQSSSRKGQVDLGQLSISSQRHMLSMLHQANIPAQIAPWLVSPFKAPEKNKRKNERFNHAVSHIRIRSEHAIGFLKGCFQSLKNLRVRIMDKNSHTFATYWIAACIRVHNFALKHEAEERAEGESVADDSFVEQGLSSPSSSSSNEGKARETGPGSTSRIRAGKKRRIWLRKAILEHLDKKEQRRRARK